MLIQWEDGAVTILAPAKVNLFLEVLGKRPDGYHEIATLMVAVDLYDKLAFKEDDGGAISLRCDHPGLSCGADNLVWRAAELLRRRTGCTKGAEIWLQKSIPLAAGLAGGSTDAAATLAGLNELWGLNLTRERLAILGQELGSDVPFFFATPAAWCTGRGEKVAAVILDKPLFFVLVCPAVGLATAEVYRNVNVPEVAQTGDEIRAAIAAGKVEEIGRHLHNRLQPAAERLCPQIAILCRRLEGLRPAGQLMSGSGSSVFALCRDRREVERIAHELRHGTEEEVSPTVFLVQSCSQELPG